MSIENHIFKRMHPDFDKLIQYGFMRKDNQYIYSQEIMNHELKMELSISLEGTLSGKVYDLDFNEEYTTFRIKKQLGEYAKQTKEEYEHILNDIAHQCFVQDPFIFDQSNRITDYIFNTYGDQPDYKWEKSPGCGVFFNPDNKKWYGIIMNIDKSKIDDGHGEIEIMNLKLDPDKILELLKKDGFYKCYHMNKKQWISIILDNTIEDDVIMKLIDESHTYTVSQNRDSLENEWIVPANPQYYNLKKAFLENDTILWKQSTHIKVNDIVYLYVAKPYSSIMYQCQVIQINIPYQYHDKNIQMKYVMKIKCIKEYQQGLLSFDKLKEFGIKAIRGPRHMPKALHDEIEKQTD